MEPENGRLEASVINKCTAALAKPMKNGLLKS